MRHTIHRLAPAVVTGLLLATLPFAPSVLAQGEAFVATATHKTASGKEISALVNIVITRPTTDAERTAAGAALKKGGTAALVTALKAMPDAGYMEVGGQKTTIKYAYQRSIGGGRLVTVISPTPIVHLGSGLPDAKPKAGFDLAIALLELKDGAEGTGELVPAGTAKITETGAIQTQDYATEIVRLTGVKVKK